MKTKKKTVAGTTVFFALCQKYLRTLALIELYHVGEARVKKVGAWKGKIGVIFRQKNLKSGGATTTPLRCRVPKRGKIRVQA